MSGAETSLEAFFAAWELYREPVLAGTLAGAVLGALGVFLVPRRLVFLSATLGQTATVGVVGSMAVTSLWGWERWWSSPLLLATLASGLLVAALSRDRTATGVYRDRILGTAFLLSISAGYLAISLLDLDIKDVQTMLFGSAVTILPESFALLATIYGLLLLLLVIGARGFIAASFFTEEARVRGLPTKTLELVLLGMIAIAVAVCARVLGSLPAFAFSVLPAIAALRIAANPARALVLATMIGGASGFLGYYLAFRLDTSVGACQTLVGVIAVLAAQVVGPIAGAMRGGGAR